MTGSNHLLVQFQHVPVRLFVYRYVSYIPYLSIPCQLMFVSFVSLFLSRGQATLHVAVSVDRSVHPSVRPPFTMINCERFVQHWLPAPAQPSATVVRCINSSTVVLLKRCVDRVFLGLRCNRWRERVASAPKQKTNKRVSKDQRQTQPGSTKGKWIN